MRYGLIGSIVLHLLVFGLVIFNFSGAETPAKIEVPLPPPVSVEIMTPGEFNQRQAGKQDSIAPKPAPLAQVKAPDVVATTKKEVDLKPVPKPAEKEALPPPPKAAEAPPVKPVEMVKVEKPAEKPAPKPVPKREAEAKPAPVPRPKPDPIKKVDERKRTDEPQRADQPEPKRPDTRPFDANRIASLLQKDEKQAARSPSTQSMMDAPPSKTSADRQTAVINRDPNAGQTGGAFEPKQPWRPASSFQDQAAGFSQATGPANLSTDADLLFSQISQQWDLPVGGAGAETVVIKMRFGLAADGMLSREPEILNPSRNPAFIAAADAAKRAVYRAQPFKFPPGRYEQFRNNTISFDPSDMYGAGRG